MRVSPISSRKLSASIFTVGWRSTNFDLLTSLGLTTIGDVARVGEDFLGRRLGSKLGQHLSFLSRGIDGRQLNTDREARSISTERTFTHDLKKRDQILDYLRRASEEVASSLRKEKVRARTVRLKVRSGSFRTLTRSVTSDPPTDVATEIFRLARSLFDRVDLAGEGVRLLGIAGAGLLGGDAPIQEGLFDEGIERGRSVEKLIDSVNLMGGEGSIGRARILRSEEQDRSGPRLSAP